MSRRRNKGRKDDPRRLVKLILSNAPEAELECNEILVEVLKKALQRRETTALESVAIAYFSHVQAQRYGRQSQLKRRLWLILSETDGSKASRN